MISTIECGSNHQITPRILNYTQCTLLNAVIDQMTKLIQVAHLGN